MKSPEELNTLLGKESTTLKDLEDAGLVWYSNGYSTYFRDRVTKEYVRGLPHWVEAMIVSARASAKEEARGAVLISLGLCPSGDGKRL